ncbi:carboxylesterase, partial [Vararia minispora EC-137]
VHQPVVRHAKLKTTFTGIQHSLSTSEVTVNQFRGIKYAFAPARFRQSQLFTSYHSRTDASRYGPVCPQPRGRRVEDEIFGFEEDEYPVQNLKQIESECLNLNITVPAGISRDVRLPVMVWIHGGGSRGSGNHWLYDCGAFVQNSVKLGKPVILVTFNYRLGILGCAVVKDPEGRHEDEGLGNFGLRDQRRALEWVHHFIGDFGGDASNVTLFGEGTGAADVLCHLASRDNVLAPLFHRVIVQSPIIENAIPTASQAAAHLSRSVSALGLVHAPELRKVEIDKLVVHPPHYRAVDDGLWFREGWKDILGFTDSASHHLHASHQHLAMHIHAHPHSPHTHSPHHDSPHGHSPKSHSQSRSRSPGTSAPLPPVIIGDCGFESYQFAEPASMWNVLGVHRRIKAIVHNLHRANALFNAYDITQQTPDDELPDRLLELINDARFAWSNTHRVARALTGAGAHVWRYVFDQEAPKRGVPHHASDVLYLFDNARPVAADVDGDGDGADFFPESFSDDEDEPSSAFDNSAFEALGGDDAWNTPVVDLRTYERVRDAMQGRWLAFAHGVPAPWGADKVYVFGPEGETGERRLDIFAGRRRTEVWTNVFEPLGRDVVLKIGTELSNGPP